MENTATRRRLMRKKKGNIFIISGKSYSVMKVVDYRLRTAGWRDILVSWLGQEEVLELSGESDVVRVWRKTEGLHNPIIFDSDTVVFWNEGDEELFKEESGKPRVIVNGEDEGRIAYAIYVGESGRTVCLEQWPGERLEAYLLESELPLSYIEFN